MDLENLFENLVLYCMEADCVAYSKIFYSKVFQIAEAVLFKQWQEVKKLYNPYRTLFLDKYYGESKRALGGTDELFLGR